MSVLEQVPIWLPGQGVVDVRAARVDRAVQQYDERLRFGRNEANGQYAIFIKFPPGDDYFPELYPILGFGFDIPEPEAAIRRLEAADTLKHGERMLDEMHRRNRERLARFDEPIQEAQEEFALAAESFLRNRGETRWGKSYSKEHVSKRTRGG